jgi:hypothetical protein
MSPYSHLPCWEIMRCAEDKRCPAKEHPEKNCWDIFCEADPRLTHICRDCLVYIARRGDSSLPMEEIERIMAHRNFLACKNPLIDDDRAATG